VGHLLKGRLLTAHWQWRSFYRRSGHSKWMSFRKLILEPLLLERVAIWLDHHIGRRAIPWKTHSPIRAEFATQMEVDLRARALGHDFRYRGQDGERFKNLTVVDYSGDWLAAEKALFGVEVRDPTADIGVVSFCLGVPPKQYLVEGIDRSLIRRAMWGVLLEVVLINRLRGLQAADWYEKLEAQLDDFASELAELSTSPLVREAIDLERL
jgi:asparagine synthase (glutamine-hydrolysing)